MNASLKEIKEDLDFTSDRLSQQVRLASTAALAWAWGLTVADPEALSHTTHRCQSMLVAIMILALASLGTDLVQYLVGYGMSLALLRRLEDKNKPSGEYNTKSVAYRARMFLFFAKLILVLLAIALCLYTGAVYLSDARYLAGGAPG